MYRHLVVAVDGSEISLHALQHACGVVRHLSARLTLVHVANPVEYMVRAASLPEYDTYDAAAADSGRQLLASAAHLAQQSGVAKVQTHLLISDKALIDMAKDLLDYVDSQGADLLVLGTHGRSGLMHMLMGSFAQAVMSQGRVPLLLVRGDAD